MEAECLEKNRIFFHYITEKTPYVIMKYAMTADGKIACVTGDSRWVTAEEAREHTHRTRRAVTGIMVGIHTVLQDDPMLNCRWKEDPVDPVRIVCDSRLRIPLESRIVQTAKDVPVMASLSEKTLRMKRETESSGRQRRKRSFWLIWVWN